LISLQGPQGRRRRGWLGGSGFALNPDLRSLVKSVEFRFCLLKMFLRSDAMDTWSLKPIQEELALTGSFERFLPSFQNMFTSSANLQAFLLDFYDIIRPQHDFFCRNRGKKRLKIDWRVKLNVLDATRSHILYVFSFCCDLLVVSYLGKQTDIIVFKFSINFGAFFGEIVLNFPPKIWSFHL